MTGKCILPSSTTIDLETTDTPKFTISTTTQSPIFVPSTTVLITKIISTKRPLLYWSTKAPSVETTTVRNTPPSILTKLEDTLVKTFDPMLTKVIETPVTTPFETSAAKVPQVIPTNGGTHLSGPLSPGYFENKPVTGLEDTVNKFIPLQTTGKSVINDDLIIREIAPIVEAVPTKAPKFDIPTQPTLGSVNIPTNLSPTLDSIPKIPIKIDFATTSRTIPLEDTIPRVFSDIPIPYQTTRKSLVDTDWIAKEIDTGFKAVVNVFETPTTKPTVNSNILDKGASFINAFPNPTPVTVPHTLPTFALPTLSVNPPTFGTKTKVIDKLNLQAEVEKSFKSVVSSVIDEFGAATTTERNIIYNVVNSLGKANSNAGVKNHFTSIPTNINVKSFSSNIDMKVLPTIPPMATNDFSLPNKTPSNNPPSTYNPLPPLVTMPPVKLTLPPVISENSPNPPDMSALTPKLPINPPTLPPTNPSFILTLPTLPSKPTFISTLPPVLTLLPVSTNPTFIPTLPPKPTFIPTLPPVPTHAPTLPPMPTHAPTLPTLPPVPTNPPNIPTFPTLPPKPSVIPTLPPMPTNPLLQWTIPPFIPTNSPAVFTNLPNIPAIFTNPPVVPTNSPPLLAMPTFPVIPKNPPPIPNIHQVPTHHPAPLVTPENFPTPPTTVLLDRSLFEVPPPAPIIPKTNHFNDGYSKSLRPLESHNVFTTPPLNSTFSFNHTPPPAPAVEPTDLLESFQSFVPQLKTSLAQTPKELPIETYLPQPILKERHIDKLQAELPIEIPVETTHYVVTTTKPTLKPVNPEIDKAIGIFENSLNDLMKSMEHVGLKKGNSQETRSKGSRYNNIQNDAPGRELTDLRLAPGVAIREDENEFMSDRNYHPTSVGKLT